MEIDAITSCAIKSTDWWIFVFRIHVYRCSPGIWLLNMIFILNYDDWCFNRTVHHRLIKTSEPMAGLSLKVYSIVNRFLCWNTARKSGTTVYCIYIYAFSRRFYPKRLTVHSGYTCFISMCVLWESNPQPFALLTQCSTTEPQEHLCCIYCTVNVEPQEHLCCIYCTVYCTVNQCCIYCTTLSLTVLLIYIGFSIRHKYVWHESTSDHQLGFLLYLLLLNCTPHSISSTQHHSHSHSTHPRGSGQACQRRAVYPCHPGTTGKRKT